MFDKLKSKFGSDKKAPATSRGHADSYYAPPAGAPPPGQGQGGFAPPPGAPPAGALGLSGPLGENQLASLRRFDTVLLIDDSGSMEFWENEVRPAMVDVVKEAVKWDTDGIDIYFFNTTNVAENVSKPESVIRLFDKVRPNRSTPTATALKRITEPYMQKYETAQRKGQQLKPLNILCLTDGAPNRGEDPEPVIVDLARRLDAMRAPQFQVGIQFIQVGNDSDAREALMHLDDNLENVHHVRDMVDTVTATEREPITSDNILKVLLGAVNRKVDG